MKDQQREILSQVAAGAISAEEGATRLDALDSPPTPTAVAVPVPAVAQYVSLWVVKPYRDLWDAVVLWVGKQVFAEDASIYEGVQRGMAASPHAGVIGTREERIHVFQKYVLDHTRGASELPLAPVEANGQG